MVKLGKYVNRLTWAEEDFNVRFLDVFFQLILKGLIVMKNIYLFFLITLLITGCEQQHTSHINVSPPQLTGTIKSISPGNQTVVYLSNVSEKFNGKETTKSDEKITLPSGDMIEPDQLYQLKEWTVI